MLTSLPQASSIRDGADLSILEYDHLVHTKIARRLLTARMMQISKRQVRLFRREDFLCECATRISPPVTSAYTALSSNPSLHASSAPSMQSTGLAVSPRSICWIHPSSVLPAACDAAPARVSSPLDHSSIELFHQ